MRAHRCKGGGAGWNRTTKQGLCRPFPAVWVPRHSERQTLPTWRGSQCFSFAPPSAWRVGARVTVEANENIDSLSTALPHGCRPEQILNLVSLDH
jgi:hypothetical protein